MSGHQALTQHRCYQPQSRAEHLRSDTLEQELALVGNEHGQIKGQARCHVEAERAIRVDVPPGQRRVASVNVVEFAGGAGAATARRLEG